MIDDVAEEVLMLPIGDDVKVGEVNEENNSVYLFDKHGEGMGWHDYEMKDGEMLVEQTQKTNSKYYIHNVSQSRRLMNGFRWIKEMLLQNHNHRMYKAYTALKEKGIEVYAVKTDAFHISKADIKKAKKGFDFSFRYRGLEGGKEQKCCDHQLKNTFGNITNFQKYQSLQILLLMWRMNGILKRFVIKS